MGLVEQFSEELAVIKKTRLTFAVGFVVLACLIGGAEYAVYKEWLSQKDSLIDTLEKRLAAKGDSEKPALGRTLPSSTGSATTFGSNSPANTGQIGTLNNGNGEHDNKAK